jgi:hypothetical protein
MLKSNIQIVKKDENLIDGKHHTFRCRRCDAPLIEIWVVRPNDPISNQIIVECAHCGGRSNPQTIEGMFTIEPIEEKGIIYSGILNVDYESNPMIIQTQKIVDYKKNRKLK